MVIPSYFAIHYFTPHIFTYLPWNHVESSCFFNVVFDTSTLACDWHLKREDVTTDDDRHTPLIIHIINIMIKANKTQNIYTSPFNPVAIQEYFGNNNMIPEWIAARIEKQAKQTPKSFNTPFIKTDNSYLIQRFITQHMKK